MALNNSCPLGVVSREPSGSVLRCNPSCQKALSKSGAEAAELLSFNGVFRRTADCRYCEWTNPVFSGDDSCLYMFQILVSMEATFNAIFNNDCRSFVGSTIGVFCVVYCIVRDFNVASRGEMCFRNLHDARFLVVFEGFDFCRMLGEPIGIP